MLVLGFRIKHYFNLVLDQYIGLFLFCKEANVLIYVVYLSIYVIS